MAAAGVPFDNEVLAELEATLEIAETWDQKAQKSVGKVGFMRDCWTWEVGSVGICGMRIMRAMESRDERLACLR